MPFPIYRDVNSKLADHLRALSTPHAFVILGDSTIAFQGGVTNSTSAENADRIFLKEALEDISKKRKVKKAKARALGCSIRS